MDGKITNRKVKTITAVSKEQLPYIHDIASKAGWEDSFDVLERIFCQFGKYMKVALNDKGQVLGKFHLTLCSGFYISSNVGFAFISTVLVVELDG